MSYEQQASFSRKVPISYQIIHKQYLKFNEYTKKYNKPPTHQQLKQNIKKLQILSQEDDLQEQNCQDINDKIVNEYYQRMIHKSRSMNDKKIQIILNSQKYMAQKNVRMENLKHSFKNSAILLSNYRNCFQSLFNSEEEIKQEDDIEIIKEQRVAFQLELNKLEEIYPKQAQFILEQLRPKVIKSRKSGGIQVKQKQSEYYPQLQKESQRIESQHRS